MLRSGRLRRLARARVLFAALLMSSVGAIATAAAEPYIPSDDDQVLARVPVARSGEWAVLRDLRRKLDREPRDLATAVDLAGHYLQQGRAEGEPRFAGYAQAALTPWWRMAEPPLEVRVLRATILQNRHDFEAALLDLDGVLRVAPRHRQARLTRATILRAQGRAGDAAAECAALLTMTDGLVVTTCLADAVGLQGGRARQAHDGLLRAYESADATAGDADPRLRLWALTVLAEIAVRLGDAPAAERHFRAARALGIRDSYLLAAETDFLLDQGRPAEARALLLGAEASDGALLRLAIAERRLGDPGADVRIAELCRRFAAARARSDDGSIPDAGALHLREEARFALDLLGDASAALNLAERNWRSQREPADARLLLESARAAGEPAAARPAIDWIDETGIEDVRLHPLAASLRPAPAG